MPEKFDLTYIGEDGQKHRPVMIHRVVFGSIERFIGILTEHFAGAFPIWLAPVQIRLLPITDRHLDYCYQIKKEAERRNIRAEVDERNEKIGYKIREGQLERIPYLLVVGDKEVEGRMVAVRKRKSGDLGAIPVEEFFNQAMDEIARKTLD
jgi:threonyl-tRNA synthetase